MMVCMHGRGSAWLIPQVLAALLAVQLLTGCATVPVEDLRSYASAYEQVERAGNAVLDEVSPYVVPLPADGPAEATSRTEASCQSGAEPFPECFDPKLALREAGVRAGEPPGIAQRRAALAAVTTYNAALVDLAEGRSVEALGRRFDELQEFVAAAASFAAPATAGLSTLGTAAVNLLRGLAQRLEAARANATIRESLIASRGDIQMLLQLLIDDTPTLYELYVNRRGGELLELERRMPFGAVNDSEAATRVQAEMTALEDQISAFHGSLGAYVRLLHDASASLDALLVAVQSRNVSLPAATALVRDAAEINAEADRFFDLLRAARRPAPATG
jgi:hypothetical protein